MGNKVLIKAVFVALVLFFVIGVMAMTGCAALKIKASVAGYVYKNQKLMPNFTVQLIDEGGTVVADGKTNQQGHFIIQDVPPGKYTVRLLNFSGNPEQKTFDITVRPGRTETADFDLGGELIPEPKASR